MKPRKSALVTALVALCALVATAVGAYRMGFNAGLDKSECVKWH